MSLLRQHLMYHKLLLKQVCRITLPYPLNIHSFLAPPFSILRMQHRDPDGHFATLTPSEKKKLIYCTDLGIYDPNNELVDFDNLPDVLVPGVLVIVDANLF